MSNHKKMTAKLIPIIFIATIISIYALSQPELEFVRDSAGLFTPEKAASFNSNIERVRENTGMALMLVTLPPGQEDEAVWERVISEMEGLINRYPKPFYSNPCYTVIVYEKDGTLAGKTDGDCTFNLEDLFAMNAVSTPRTEHDYIGLFENLVSIILYYYETGEFPEECGEGLEWNPDLMTCVTEGSETITINIEGIEDVLSGRLVLKCAGEVVGQVEDVKNSKIGDKYQLVFAIPPDYVQEIEEGGCLVPE